MRRPLLPWLAALLLLVAGFGASVLALNASVFSPSGFVRGYLDAMERGDAATVLALDGVVVPPTDGTALLTGPVLAKAGGASRVVRVQTQGERELVSVTTDLGDGVQQSLFTLERAGTRFGLFPVWRFAVSPLAHLEVTVTGATRLRANGVEVAAGRLAVLTPGRYTLDHASDLLAAAPTAVDVLEPGGTVSATLAAEPTPLFTERAGEAVAGFLSACAGQQVLQPAGCPFGTSVENRLEGAPSWSFPAQPVLSLTATETPGVWRAGASGGSAHLTARVRSLYDGTVSTLERTVPLAGDYLVVIEADGSLRVGGA